MKMFDQRKINEKKVTFSKFNQIFIIPNIDQLKLLQTNQLDCNIKKYGRFTIEYNFGKT